MAKHTIAVIPGDGIGREVIPEGIRVLEAVGAKYGVQFDWQEFPWSCDWYKQHGKMCPDDAPQILRKFDAIYFGAVGDPTIVPDHVSAWGLLINFRRWFDLYVNLRPVRLFEGLPCPLAGRKPGDIDYMVVRENTEGEYGNVGGRIWEGTEREVVTQQAVFSRKGTDRIMKYAFELAKRRNKHVTSCTKSNGISITMPYWDERFAEMKKSYPDVKADQYHVDGLSIQMVLNPDRFDVIVASNLFGDILSDLGPATAGTIGIAPSGNINPEKTFPRSSSRCTARRPTSRAGRSSTTTTTIMPAARFQCSRACRSGPFTRRFRKPIRPGSRRRATGCLAPPGRAGIGTGCASSCCIRPQPATRGHGSSPTTAAAYSELPPRMARCCSPATSSCTRNRSCSRARRRSCARTCWWCRTIKTSPRPRRNSVRN